MTTSDECPVTALCTMHVNGEAWLEAGDLEALERNDDVFWIMHRRAWRRCTCDLFNRIQAALGVRKQRRP